MRLGAVLTATAACCAAVLAGCADTDDAVADRKADEFTQAVRDNGSAPEMTADRAKDMYGDDGGVVCGALENNDAGVLLAWGRGALTHTPDEKADDVREYDRQVVRTYCPEEMGEYTDLLDRLHNDD